MKCEGPHTLHLASDHVLEPQGTDKALLSFLLLKIVEGHIVIENDKQDE